MAHTRFPLVSCLIAGVLAFPFPSAAFDTPLSDTAVRQAYFMGQRHDESLARFLDKYVKHLPAPKTGPYISSVTFFTPYALLAQLSSQQLYGYSAQQAELAHRRMVETVQIVVEIQLTDAYPAFMPNPSVQTTGTPWDYIPRSSNFWQDFQIHVISDKKTLAPIKHSGESNYICGDSTVQPIALGEYCTLVGASVQLEFPADAFAPGEATIQVDPPEGDQVAVDFDLSSFR